MTEWTLLKRIQVLMAKEVRASISVLPPTPSLIWNRMENNFLPILVLFPERTKMKYESQGWWRFKLRCSCERPIYEMTTTAVQAGFQASWTFRNRFDVWPSGFLETLGHPPSPSSSLSVHLYICSFLKDTFCLFQWKSTQHFQRQEVKFVLKV